MWVPLASLFEVVAFVNQRTLDQTGTHRCAARVAALPITLAMPLLPLRSRAHGNARPEQSRTITPLCSAFLATECHSHYWCGRSCGQCRSRRV